MTAEHIAKSLAGKKSASGWMTRCPAHDDRNPSLSLTERNGVVLVKCHAGCDQAAVVSALKARGLWPERETESRSRIAAEYDYRDEDGKLLYQVVRCEPKNFFQRRPDGHGGWVNKKGERQVLYRLREILEAPIVFVVEGEKDVETLRAYGFVATTNAGGAKAPWLPEYTEALRGREVILIPDNDEPGRARVLKISRALVHNAAVVNVVALKNAKDVSEWFEQGHSELELIALSREPGGCKIMLIADEADVDRLAANWELPDHAAASSPNARAPIKSVSEIPSIRTFAAQKIDFLVEGLIAAGTVTAITGDSGCGKSTFVTALASAVERGIPFAELQTQRRPVLVLDRENPLSVTVERFNRLGIDDSANFTVWGGRCPEEAPAPNSPIVTRWVESLDPKPLIVIDSLVAFNPGDENDATQMRAFMQELRRLADTGATVIVLHHNGKGEGE